MKYCMHCGSEINDDAVVCIHCGCSVEPIKNKTKSNVNTLITVAKIFMIISCAAYPAIGLFYGAFLIIGAAIAGAAAQMIIAGIIFLIGFCIPLAWMLPMTITVSKKSKQNEPISVALKVCVLLFVNVIAGILLLCADDE